MSRGLTIFAKGNLDVRDSLHSLRLGGAIAWNGVNEIIRERFPGCTLRIRHELHTRSDALLAATGVVPAELEERRALLEPYVPEAQFSRALFETEVDAYVLSIQADVMTALFRNRRDGYLLYPAGQESWPSPDRSWLREQFSPVGMLDAESAMRALEGVVERIHAAVRHLLNARRG